LLKLRVKPGTPSFPVRTMHRDDAAELWHHVNRTYLIEREGLRPLSNANEPLPKNYLDVEVHTHFKITTRFRSDVLDDMHLSVEDFFSILQHAGIHPTFGLWGLSTPPTIWFALSPSLKKPAVYEIGTMWGGGEKEVHPKIRCKKLDWVTIAKAKFVDQLLYTLIKETTWTPGGTSQMKAIVKATGKKTEVRDYGPKFHPRYWDDTQGYNVEELTFNS